MICKYCSKAAQIQVKMRDEKQHPCSHWHYRMTRKFHELCKGCDCQHKDVKGLQVNVTENDGSAESQVREVNGEFR